MNLTLMDLHLLAGADYVKSKEYSSELVRKNSKMSLIRSFDALESRLNGLFA